MVTAKDTDELVEWGDVVAWQAACACGWLGRRWERAATIAGECSSLDAADAFLPDGSTVEDAARVDWESHTDPRERLARVKSAAAELEQARRRLEEAVIAARFDGRQPASWSDIGTAAGMSKQAAHERWAGLTTKRS